MVRGILPKHGTNPAPFQGQSPLGAEAGGWAACRPGRRLRHSRASQAGSRWGQDSIGRGWARKDDAP